jgi:hypothetical protein
MRVCAFVLCGESLETDILRNLFNYIFNFNLLK